MDYMIYMIYIHILFQMLVWYSHSLSYTSRLRNWQIIVEFVYLMMMWVTEREKVWDVKLSE